LGICGVDISFNAMIKYYKKYKKTNINIDEQKQFFYNYANIWKFNIRKKEAEKKLLTDTHSPPYNRVNTILPNIDAFYKVFNITPNNMMWLDVNKRVKIW
jgi:predicted metalloendopeptidase